MPRSLHVLTLAWLASVAGCNQTLPPTPAVAESTKTNAPQVNGGVAVIDIEAISERLGLSKELQVRIQGHQQHLEAFERAKQGQIVEMQKKLGEKPTEEQIKEFRKADMEGGAEIQRARAKAQQQFNEYRNYIVNVLDLTLKDPVDKVMKQRGLTIVLHARQGVYRRADSADITQEVLDILAKNPDAIKLPTTAGVQSTADSAPKSSGLMPDLPSKGVEDKAPQTPAVGELRP
jgi:Skp family chaperone for outer membrane proteins